MDATQQEPIKATTGVIENQLNQQSDDQLEAALRVLEDGISVRRIKRAKIQEPLPLLLDDKKWLKYPVSFNPFKKLCNSKKVLKKGLFFCSFFPAFFIFVDKYQNLLVDS